MHELRANPCFSEYLTVGEAAEFLGVSPWTLRNWDKAGKLKTLRHPKNGYRIYRHEDLEQVLQPEGLPSNLKHRRTPSVDWSETPESEHVVQFYESDAFLVGSVANFIGTALNAGNGGLIIATRAHRIAIQRKLRAYGLDLTLARAQGHYVALDAAETLSKIMENGSPEPRRFTEVVGAMVDQVRQSRPRVRAFGEMVALLWADGNRAAAIRLEELWNEQIEARRFALLCAYPLHGFGNERDGAPFNNVCTCHSRVIPAESFATLSMEDDRLRAIIRLQQKAESLEAEITHRNEVEKALTALRTQHAAELAGLRRLHEMTMRLSGNLELRPVLTEILQTAADLEGTDLGLVSLCAEEKKGLQLSASLGFEKEFLKLIEHVPPGGGVCGTCWQERRRIIIEDVATDPLFAPYRDAARLAGFRAVHSTPLITRSGTTIGVLSTHFRVPHRPSEHTMHLLDLCAHQAADFIENARLYQRAQEEIAERKRAESALRAADRRKDEFLAVLAHELRNPLAPVRNALQIMRLAGDNRLAIEQARAMMERQVHHLVRLVDDLLDLSRITRGNVQLKKARVAFSSIVAIALETSRPLIEAARQELQVSLPADTLELEADSTRLAQVFSNLLNNAAKYSDPGGRIWFTAEREGDQVAVGVRDTGIGIPAEMLPRIFDMFMQVDRFGEKAQGGLGIGLTLVRTLTEMHAGSVEVKSAGLGHGSEFMVRLPLAPKHPPRTSDCEGHHCMASTPTLRRVLIVDDNEDAAHSLALLLRLIGQDVRTAHDGPAALEVVRDFQPDIAFLDIGLPGMNGYELAKRLRQEPGGDKVFLVALTGWGQEEDRRRSREAGFDHHLTKPADPAALEPLLSQSRKAAS